MGAEGLITFRVGKGSNFSPKASRSIRIWAPCQRSLVGQKNEATGSRPGMYVK